MGGRLWRSALADYFLRPNDDLSLLGRKFSQREIDQGLIRDAALLGEFLKHGVSNMTGSRHEDEILLSINPLAVFHGRHLRSLTYPPESSAKVANFVVAVF